MDIHGVTMSYNYFIPEMIMAATAMLAIVVPLFLPQRARGRVAWLGLVGAAAAGITALLLMPADYSELLYTADDIAVYSKVFFALTAMVVLLLAWEWNRKWVYRGEFVGLVLLASLGMMLLAEAMDFVAMFLALELTALAFYALVARPIVRDPKASEAGLKYLLLGAMASAVLVYGIGLVYAAAGTTHFVEVAKALRATPIASPVILLGLVMTVVGLGFKIGIVPFHMWIPDTYEGAPTAVVAFLSVAPKAATFIVLMRVMGVAFGPLKPLWLIIFGILAFLTMSTGNLLALTQTNMKRLMAYSSIAQSGYVLLGFAVWSTGSVAGMLIYVFAYTFTNMAAFAAVLTFAEHTGSNEIEDYAGLYARSPFLSVTLAAAMLSLAGFPLFAGFVVKLLVFIPVFGGGAEAKWLYWLVGAALVNAVISMYYYLRPVWQMFAVEGKETSAVPVALGPGIAMGLGLAVILGVGFFPGPLAGAFETLSRFAFLP